MIYKLRWSCSVLRLHKHIHTQRVHAICCMPTNKILYGYIGDKTQLLMELPNDKFMQEIWTTRKQFKEQFPELSGVIHEYRKQRVLLELNLWYKKPVPKRCERFLEMEVYSLLENIDADSEEAKHILQICHSILCEYLPHKYTSQQST